MSGGGSYPPINTWRLTAYNQSCQSSITFLGELNVIENVNSSYYGTAHQIMFTVHPKYYHVVVHRWSEEDGKGTHFVSNISPGRGIWANKTNVDPFKSWLVQINTAYPPEQLEDEGLFDPWG